MDLTEGREGARAMAPGGPERALGGSERAKKAVNYVGEMRSRGVNKGKRGGEKS